MSVARSNAVAVVKDNGSPISAHEIREVNDRFGWSDNRLSVERTDVNPGVECAFTVEWVNAFAERSRDRSFYGPQIRRGVGAHPVGGGHVSRQAQSQSGSSRSAQRRIFQRVETVHRGIDLPVLDLVRRGCRDQDRVRFQPVKRRNFTGQRPQ